MEFGTFHSVWPGMVIIHRNIEKKRGRERGEKMENNALNTFGNTR